MFEEIYTAILAAAPALVSVIGIITAVIKMKTAQNAKLGEVMEKFEILADEVHDSKQYEDLKRQLLTAHQENRELRKKINELMTKIDRVSRNEEE